MNQTPSNTTESPNSIRSFFTTTTRGRLTALFVVLLIMASITMTFVSLAQSKRRKAAANSAPTAAKRRQGGPRMSAASGNGARASQEPATQKPQQRQPFPEVVEMVGAVSQDQVRACRRQAEMEHERLRNRPRKSPNSGSLFLKWSKWSAPCHRIRSAHVGGKRKWSTSVSGTGHAKAPTAAAFS